MRRMMMMKKIDGLNNEKGKRKWQSMVLEMKIEEIVCSKKEVPARVEPPAEGQSSNAQAVQAVEAWKHSDFLCHIIYNGLIIILIKVLIKVSVSLLTSSRADPFIKVVRSDRGGEYVAPFAELCAKHGIRYEFTALYSPGIAERKNRTLKEMVTAMLISSAKVAVLTPKAQKIGPKSVDCIFIGYAKNNSAYRFIVHESKNPDIQKNTVMESRNASFFEHIFPCFQKNQSSARIKIMEGYKLIFKKKMKADGTIDKYKARLVIKGYRQREGLDYFDTYSPVTRITSIRMILAIAALRKGFIAPGQEGKVCRLVKSLYGLKQAPKQWHQKFDNTMLESGFKINECDNNDKMIRSTKDMLKSKFDMKDMGLADVILGIKTTNAEGLKRSSFRDFSSKYVRSGCTTALNVVPWETDGESVLREAMTNTQTPPYATTVVIPTGASATNTWLNSKKAEKVEPPAEGQSSNAQDVQAVEAMENIQPRPAKALWESVERKYKQRMLDQFKGKRQRQKEEIQEGQRKSEVRLAPKAGIVKQKFQGTCYNCDQPGHRAANCKMPKQVNPRQANMVDENVDMIAMVSMCVAMISEVNLIDTVVQDKAQRDDNLQDERQDQTEEEEVEPRRSKRARNEKLEAIKTEIESILQNHTWELVDLPPGCKALGYKWIFKKKMKADGTIDKYKARLLTKCLDTKKGDLEEEIYMNQPEGFIAPGQEGKVCRLVKSLYGLKQAPKQWHQKFDHTMLESGFKINECDKCVYVKDTSSGYVILCLYVDDMLIIGSNDKMIKSTKDMLKSKFDMKDMGLADVILGIKIIRTHNGLVLSQAHYVDKILNTHNAGDSGLARTPIDTSTRPDLAYAVSRLSRYTSNPSVAHWKAMTRVLHYLRYSRDYGLHYDRYPAVIEGYSDANWISDIKDSRSTSGYVFTLGGAAISWKSSKQTVIAKSTMES
ncbi:retrotransposon protein, putative, ty1-copia subclass [Tanacetum coccineum]